MKLKHYPVFLRVMGSIFMNAKRVHDNANDLNVVISLTSIRSRLKYVRYAVMSLLLQNPKPRLVVLWVSPDLAQYIPRSLLRMQGARFEIRYRDDVGPHTKLVHALAEFPGEVLVTADDDMLYESTWLARLWSDHVRYPADVIGHQCRVISVDSVGNLQPYRQWRRAAPGEASQYVLPLGFSGVLYPPGSLAAEAVNAKLFRRLAPKADDLWFRAMSLINGVRARRSSSPPEKPIPLPFSQAITLNSENVAQDGNRSQWVALSEHYRLELPPPESSSSSPISDSPEIDKARVSRLR